MGISKFRGEAGYVFGRVSALGARPLMLLAANHLAGNSVASTIAVVFLVVTLAMATSAFDSHRGFYQAYFKGGERRQLKLLYRIYASSCVLQNLVVSLPLLGYMVWRHHQWPLAIGVVAYLWSERLADESQRFLIFKGLRGEWGRKILVKACIQTSGVAAACAWGGVESAPSLAAWALVLGNLAAYDEHVRAAYLPWQFSGLQAAWQCCRAQSLFGMLSVATAVIAYMDRIVVMVFQQSDMAMFTLLVSCLSLIQNAMDYFFISLRRKEILQAKVSLRDVFLSRGLYVIIGASAAIGAVLCWVMVYLYRGQSIEQWVLIPVVLVSQITLALTLVIREMMYWNQDIRRLITLEVAFILTALMVLLGLRQAGADYVTVLGILSALFVGRLLLMIRSAATATAT